MEHTMEVGVVRINETLSQALGSSQKAKEFIYKVGKWVNRLLLLLHGMLAVIYSSAHIRAFGRFIFSTP